MEHLQQEFDALKLTMEMKYKADIERLSRQVAQQNAHIDDITKQIVGLKEHRDHLPIPGTYRNITQGKRHNIIVLQIINYGHQIHLS